MHYSQMQSSVTAMPARSEPNVQPSLQLLVENLDWTYVALWSLNHQTRNLGWKGGHFRVNSTAVTGGHGIDEVWNEQLFDSTYKSCHFTRKLGSVGTAHAEGRNIWMNGPSVLKHAGSKEQAEFLQHARIATALCIPCADGVLELGTSETVLENLDLLKSIRHFVSKNIVPALGQLSSHNSLVGVSQAPPIFPQSSLAPRSMMQQHATFSSLNPLMSENLSSPNFEPNSLNQQIRRTGSLSSLNTDMFLQHPEDGTEAKDHASNELDTYMLLNPDSRTWRLPTTRASDSLPIAVTVAASQAFPYYPPAQQSARGQYRSRTSTTSSSVSSLDDGSAKQSVDSPEQNNMTFLGASSQRRTSHSNTSSSPTRGASSHSPETNQLEDVTTTKAMASLQESARVDDDIQTAISLMLAEGEADQEQWQSMYSPLEIGSMSQMNLLESSTNGNHSISSFNTHVVGNGTRAQTTTTSMGEQTQGPFKSWRHTRILAPTLQKDDRTNQELLRRCIGMMKQIPNLQQGAQNQIHESARTTLGPINVGQQGQRGASSSSPETVPDSGIAHDPFDQPGPPSVQRRPRGGSRIASMGPVHTGHDEAALNHMMAERRRRVKQKDNFTALRKLVPIISKADKASILGDAIVYLKDLQEQNKKLKASRDEAQRRFEILQVSYNDLKQRNKELEAMAGSNALMQQQGSTRGLHSMPSF